MKFNEYPESYRTASEHQGLRPLAEALDAKGVGYTLEQTGGWTMVLTMPGAGGTWAATDDGVWLLGFFPGNTWWAGDRDEDAGDEEYPTLDAMVARMVEVAP